VIVGLSFDLKEAMAQAQIQKADDALEEYDSPATVDAIAGVFRTQGHQVNMMGGGRRFLNNILRDKVDIVFNISEGSGNFRSREAQVPSVLEMLNVPYCGSDPQSLAICLDKPLTKQLVSHAGVITPGWHIFSKTSEVNQALLTGLRFPVFVKPAWEGSSKGIRLTSKIESPSDLKKALGTLLEAYGQPVMAEEYIAGAEVTVGVVGNTPPRIVGIMQVIPKTANADFVYSLEVKRDWERLVEYQCPARFKAETMARIAEATLTAYRVLGCRDFGRLDFRVTDKGIPYFIEVNPLPGLNPHSGDLPIMSRLAGWSYERLVSEIFEAGWSRYDTRNQGITRIQ